MFGVFTQSCPYTPKCVEASSAIQKTILGRSALVAERTERQLKAAKKSSDLVMVLR